MIACRNCYVSGGLDFRDVFGYDDPQKPSGLHALRRRFWIMKTSYGHGHCGVHVRDPKCLYAGERIGVSRDEYELHDVTMSTTDDVMLQKKSVTRISD